MASELLSCRLLVRNAAMALDKSKSKVNLEDGEAKIDATTLCASAKLMATEKCFTIIDNCLQFFGGYGYLHDQPLQQLLRDTRVHRILEGTNEIMKLIIARQLLAKHLDRPL